MASLIDFIANQQKLLGVRANFVTNKDGDLFGQNGSSRDLSSASDYAMLIRLRSLADLVITDAATARIENYKPSKLAPIQIWSQSGDFRGFEQSGSLTLRSVRSAPSELRALREQGLAILLETGPTLTSVFAKASLIDELKLSVVGAMSTSDAEHAAATVRAKLRLSYLETSNRSDFDETQFFTFTR